MMQALIPVSLLLCMASVGQEAAPPRSNEAADVRLLAHEALDAELEQLAAEYPDLVRVTPIGRSRGGRALRALRLGAEREGVEKPGILLVANLEGPRVFESAVALHHARRLASDFATDEKVRALLESADVFILPRANPDAAEARFETPLEERWSSSVDIDNDRDGRLGEDPPADVDGDGRITHLRARDPAGEWMEDPSDPRALVEADRAKGERGVFELHVEGRDLDGDEEVAEDRAGDARVDLNFASGWPQHTPGAGLFPTDEPEVRDLCDFVLLQKNLALVVVYGGHDNLVKAPESVKDDAPAVKRVPPEGWLESDAEILAEIGRRYGELTDNEAQGGGAAGGGSFARWCYDHRGLLVLEVALWDMPLEPVEAEDETGADPDSGAEDANAGDEDSDDADAETESDEDDEPEREPSEDAQRLEWVDSVEGEAWRFVPWTPVAHPELGAVEVGGFAPYATLEPPVSEWTALADAHFDFLISLEGVLPRLSIVECEKKELGPGLWEVTGVLQNDGLLPLLTRSGRRTRTTRPARVVLVRPAGSTLLSGKPQTLVRELDGSGGRREFTWLVHGPEAPEAEAIELGIAYDSDHAGSAYRVAEEVQ